jgi:hypothetical protein
VVLKKAQKKLITLRQAAGELDVSERRVRRLPIRLKEVGEKPWPHCASIGGMGREGLEPPPQAFSGPDLTNAIYLMPL